MIAPGIAGLASTCLRRGLALAFLVVLASPGQAAPPPPERVIVPSLDRDTAGQPVSITTLLFRPPQAPAGAKVPLVIALHGCNGMFSSRAGGEAQLSQRFLHWTQAMLDDGYAVLWPDSFNPRGRREVCRIRSGERTINAATRRLDVLGALAFAARLPGIDTARMALVGWSHGGSTTLAAVNEANARVAAYRAQSEAAPWVRAAVAFYPGCTGALKAGPRWQPATPLAIHIGELDDWTPVAPCVALGEARRGSDPAVTVDVYAGSHHGFDAPSGRVVLLRDVPNGVRPGEGVHVGPNPAARALVNERVRDYLRRYLTTAGGQQAPPATSIKGQP